MAERTTDYEHTKNECPAVTLQKDDRWGGFLLQCERPKDHPGDDHEHTMNGCEPVARLVWCGTYESRDETVQSDRGDS